MFAERQIDGNIFANMSREDIATIFPQPEKFMGMKLYRIVQNVRSSSSSQTDVNTCQLLNDLDGLENESTKSTSSGCSAATRSTLSLFSKPSSDHSIQTPS